jgi:hypothetical protein
MAENSVTDLQRAVTADGRHGAPVSDRVWPSPEEGVAIRP